MTSQDRDERLATESEHLLSLAENSSILSFTSSGEPPTQYRLVFEGKGYCKDPDHPDEVTTRDQHEVELRLSYSFPESAPEVRWLTPLFHPNVSSSGFLTLSDIGMEWDSALTLDIVCEKLWDVARGAAVNEERISYPAAGQWFKREGEELGPADRRHLRDRKSGADINVIRYRRKSESVTQPSERVRVIPTPPPAVPPEAVNNQDIRFIENTERQNTASRREGNRPDILFLDE